MSNPLPPGKRFFTASDGEVFTSKKHDPVCPTCGSRMELAERELMVGGKRSMEAMSLKSIRDGPGAAGQARGVR
jgi:hypothetical protein